MRRPPTDLLDAVATGAGRDARLVLADTLEELGHAHRAEYVVAALEPDAEDRADALRLEHEASWLAAWPGLLDWEFRGGFLDSVRLTPEAFLAYGESLVFTEPVRRVELMTADENTLSREAVLEVVRHPAFARVRECQVQAGRWFDGTPVGAWFTTLAGTPAVTRLERLTVRGRNSWGQEQDFTQEELAAFCAAPHLASLRTLELEFQTTNVERPWLVKELARARFSLEALSLHSAGEQGDAVVQLARSGAFPKLRALQLGRSAAESWAAALPTPMLQGLRSLRLPAAALEALAQHPPPHLEELSLTHDEYDPPDHRDAWARMIRSAPPPRALTFRFYNPGQAILETLARSAWVSRLEQLHVIGDSQFDVFGETGALGVEAFFERGRLPALERLELHEACSERILDALSGWEGTPRVRALKVTDDYHGRLLARALPPALRARSLEGVIVAEPADVEAVLALSAPLLERLTLSFCGTEAAPFPEEQVERVLQSGLLSRLRELTVGFLMAPAERGLRALAARALPLTRLRVYDGLGAQLAVDELRERYGPRLVVG